MTDYRIISRAEWGAQPPARPATPMTGVLGWFLHYVGSDLSVAPTLEQSCATLRGLQAQALGHIRGEDYSDFEYSFAVDPCGLIFEGRGWDVQSAATYENNSHSWSVVYLGGPGTPLTDAAKGALLWLVQEGAQRQPAISFVKPHSEVFATACPGDALRAFIPELQAHLHDSPQTAPQAPPVDWAALKGVVGLVAAVTSRPIRVGDRGTKVLKVKSLLRNHGFTLPDGDVYGPELVRDVHRFKVNHGLKPADGNIVGRRCLIALYRSK